MKCVPISHPHFERSLLLLLACMMTLLPSCDAPSSSADQRWEVPSTRVGASYQAMVETPLGEHRRMAFNVEQRTFDTLVETAVPSALPPPINQAFVAFESELGISKIPVWIIGKRVDMGDVLPITPLGLLTYREGGQSQQVLVAVPGELALSTISAVKFQDFIIEYDAVKFAIEYYLRNRHGQGSITQLAWDDEQAAAHYLDEVTNNAG